MATFDAKMKDRLAVFQQAYGLPADGTADTKTWAKLADGAGEQPATSGEGTKETADKLVALEDYPTLAKIVRLEQTEEAVKAFLLAECELDIDAVLADIAADLNETTTS
jgi:peptidoglycan hydrolase-like protein with peptidoglycan-binding domain